MSSTNLQLGASDVEASLHDLFGSAPPSEYFEASDQIAIEFFSEENVKAYIYKPSGYGTPKKYWVEENDDQIIITTTVSAHHSVANKGSFRFNFKPEELAEILNHVKALYPGKTIHLISPRVESGFREDHIVIEYSCHANCLKTCIIDSKSSPNGRGHAELARIYTEKQHFFNSTDCGYHVIRTIPLLWDMIRNHRPINQNTLRQYISSSDFEHSIALQKLKKLHEIYSFRAANGDKKHTTFLFFRGGFLPSIKQASVEKILENIDKGETDIFNGMSETEKKAAKDSVLGETVREYLKNSTAKSQENPFFNPH
ncbi:hypothetical protein Lbir_2705 [Legionella birminghamensis]|uniref:Uncharacterized protein n=1 Tax=Legionella birminghamensis TaxID=28083 RepID=A0A378I7J2_9GAMM|nr:hypothetical protein [Legionella birminghamensis]KTC68103.1 hypothetical protein Lbir_2705 [Legionella birminghamensis]STX31187.1 Uncharacterised protein [Legionella birminghamensis]